VGLATQQPLELADPLLELAHPSGADDLVVDRTAWRSAIGTSLRSGAARSASQASTLALPEEVEHWSLTTLREKLIKIDARIVRHPLRRVPAGRSGGAASGVRRDPPSGRVAQAGTIFEMHPRSVLGPRCLGPRLPSGWRSTGHQSGAPELADAGGQRRRAGSRESEAALACLSADAVQASGTCAPRRQGGHMAAPTSLATPQSNPCQRRAQSLASARP
jgi:hypothetical protein